MVLSPQRMVDEHKIFSYVLNCRRSFEYGFLTFNLTTWRRMSVSVFNEPITKNDCYQKSCKHLLRTVKTVSQLVSRSDIIIVLFVSAHLEPLCY